MAKKKEAALGGRTTMRRQEERRKKDTQQVGSAKAMFQKGRGAETPVRTRKRQKGECDRMREGKIQEKKDDKYKTSQLESDESPIRPRGELFKLVNVLITAYNSNKLNDSE